MSPSLLLVEAVLMVKTIFRTNENIIDRITDLFHAKVTRKYRAHNEVLIRSITEIRQKYNARGLLYSSLPSRDVNDLYVNELRENSEYFVTALLESVCVFERCIDEDRLVQVLTATMEERLAQLEKSRISELHLWKEALMNQSLLEPYRSLDAWHHDLLEESKNQFLLKYRDYLGDVGGRWGLIKRRWSRSIWVLSITALLATLGILVKVTGLFEKIAGWLIAS